MNNIATPQFVVVLATLMSLPVALLLGRAVGQGSAKPLVLLLGVIVLGVLILGIPQWLWVFAVGSLFVPGQLTALPLPFKPMEIFLMLVIARFVVDEFIFQKRPFSLGVSPDKFFVLGLLGVVLYHGIQDRFAMRIFGSEIWGGRGYVSMLVGFLAYFVVQSTSLNSKIFRHLPTIIVLFGSIDFTFGLVSSLVPSLSPLLSKIYSNVAMGDGEAATFSTRWGFAGNFGYLLLFWSLADCRIQEFLTKGRMLKAAVFCLGLALCIASGYRSSIAIASIIVFLGIFRDFGFAGSLGIIPVILFFAGLVALQSLGIQLPVQVQRGLTFLPGDWDASAVADAQGSNEFRSQVWELWMREEFPKHPILGRGFCLKFDDMLATIPFTDPSGSLLASYASPYSRNEAFVISGNIHHGFFSTVDRFGIVGAFFFVIWTFLALRRIFRHLISSRKEPMDPALQWLGLYIVTFTIGFPMGALRAENFIPQQLFLCGLFMALLKSRNSGKKLPVIEKKPIKVPSSNLAPVHSSFATGPASNFRTGQ